MQRQSRLAKAAWARVNSWQWLAGSLLSLLLSAGAVWAQGPPIPLARVVAVRDSIGRLLAADTRQDTLRVNRLNNLAFVLRTNEAPQAQRLARHALALAQRLGFEPGLMEAHFNMGYNFRARSRYDSAIYHSRQALAFAIRTHSQYTQTRAYYNLARSYAEQGNYAAALNPSLDGLALAHTMHNSRAELFQLVQAGRIELALDGYAAAQAYIVQARGLLAAAHDPLGTGYVYQTLGDLSRQRGQWLAARRAYSQARANYAQVYTERGLLPIDISIAEMTHQLGELQAAHLAATQLLHQAQASGTPEQVAQAALLLARTWLPARPDSARRYAALSLATARPRHLQPQARDAAQLLGQTSDQLGQGHAAYQYQLLASAYADSLSGEDTRRRLAAAQARALRTRAQIQVDLLQQQQLLERLGHRQQVVGLVGLGVLLVGGVFWYYRRRQASREAALRQRLAADLHDDVGNLLTQVSMEADILRETSSASPAQAQVRLQRLSDTSRRAKRQMADVVWGLHTSALTLSELLTHMRDHAYEVLPAAGLLVDFAVEPEALARNPSPNTCHHLYLIYKEALHNAVKHARHATQVTVLVFAKGRDLGLRVQDDGQPPSAPVPTRPDSHGLRNMRQRAEALGGTLHAAPGPEGFVLEASLPMS
jgi:signal transduction histidine kinase